MNICQDPPHLPQDSRSPPTRYRFLRFGLFLGHRGAALKCLRFHLLNQPHLLQKVLQGVQPQLLFHQLVGPLEFLDFHVTRMLHPEGTLPRHCQHLAALAERQQPLKAVVFVLPQPFSSTPLIPLTSSPPPRCTCMQE